MKWLLVFLLGINAVLLVIQLKVTNSEQQSFNFIPNESAEQIKLLKEKDGDEQSRCLVIGPLSSGKDFDDVQSQLIKYGYSVLKNQQTTLLAPSFWVLVEGEASDAMVEKLAGQNIESYTVASGDMRGRLSVGLFENIDLAKKLISRLQGVGVEAEIIEKQKTSRTNYLSIKLAEIGDKPALINKIKQSKINVGEIKEFFCKSIASEK